MGRRSENQMKIKRISVSNFVVVSHSIVHMEATLKYIQCAHALLLLMRIYSFLFTAS